MTDEEIDVLLAGLEESLRSRIFALPKAAWFASVASTPLIFIAEARIGFGGLSGAMALVALLTTRESRNEWQNKKKSSGALFLWREWVQREAFKESGYGYAKTIQMRNDVLEIYESNPNGDIFPLKQAIRLVDTYNNQQERLDEIASHSQGLRELRTQLLEKATQLQKLGEKTQNVQATLQRIEDDISPLESLFHQIETSCRRLESLLVSVKKSMQIKQLHSEIEELTSLVPPNESAPVDTLETGEDFIDIERQISREVETFLQLERETDRHMREI